VIGSGGISSVLGGAQGEIPTWPGIYYGVVSNNADPKRQNRCLLRIPQILGSAITTWAVSLTPQQNPPKVGTLVAAMFVGGDLDYPCYLVVDPIIIVESNNANIQPVGTTAAAGTSKNLAAADHVHTLANALESTNSNIQAVGATAVAGTSAKAARGDHVHVGIVPGTGTFEVSSGLVNGTDTAATIDLFSKDTAAQTEVDINATNVNINATNVNVGNGSTGSVNISGEFVTLTGTTPVLSGFNYLGLTPPMAVPPNRTLIDAGTATAAQICAFLSAMLASLENRGLFS
jgi:hypothetical protein